MVLVGYIWLGQRDHLHEINKRQCENAFSYNASLSFVSVKSSAVIITTRILMMESIEL